MGVNVVISVTASGRFLPAQPDINKSNTKKLDTQSIVPVVIYVLFRKSCMNHGSLGLATSIKTRSKRES